MKTLKITLAAIAVSLLATPAFANPGKKMKHFRDADQIVKQRDVKAKKLKAPKKDKAHKPKKDKAHKPEKLARSLDHPALTRPLPQRPPSAFVAPPQPIDDRVGPRPSPIEVSVASKRVKEQRKHLRRLAQIERISLIAQSKGNTRLLQRATVLHQKENLRYEKYLQQLQFRTLRKVGAPETGH